MRRVERLPEPESLKNNAAQWTRELMDEIQEKGSYAQVDNSVKNRYRQEDVKAALKKMYQKHCCYCESILGGSSYGRIEHLKPKSLPEFHHLAFEWENLHWCCEMCNTGYKRAQWDFEYPILDPSKDDIEQFLKLDLTTGEYEAIEGNKRAQTTILHTGLNREELVKARRRIIILFLKAYQTFGDEQKFCDALKLLKEDGSYPSVYDELFQAIAK